MSVSCKNSLLVWMHCLLVIPMFEGVLCLFLARTLFGIDALFIVAPNVCRGFVSVNCNDSLLA